MNSQIVGLRTASIIFGLMCLGQLCRLLTRAEVVVQGHPVPLWASGLGVVIAGSLSIWLWKLSKTPTAIKP
ncbi:MAG TPA: hypothetical protein VKM56_01280 [Verrucomicrobiae bacterium]|nr:hypothetical protein [Verrucomicrobiae bacterium]